MDMIKILEDLQSAMNLEFEERVIIFEKYKSILELEVFNNPSNVYAFSLIAMISLELRNDVEFSIKILEEYYGRNKDIISDDDFSLWATNMAYFISEEYEDYDRAIKLLTEAVKRSSKYANTYYALGKLHFMKKDFNGAKKLFNKAFKISFNNIYRYCEAISLIKLNKKEESISKLKSIYTVPFIDEEIDGKIALMLGIELALNGKEEESKKIVQCILNSDYERFNIETDDLGELMYILNDYHKCVEFYDKANLYVDDSWIGQYFFALKKIGNINKAYEKLKKIELNIEKNIYEEEFNSEDWECEDDYKDYIDSEKRRLDSIKKCYVKVVEENFKPIPNIYYDIFYKCYYINCPRHYIK
ncbi:tetratricopeptide repeat protein [Clostridium taeniosporum]|uniref:Uncharacterized protein n=1 Tax=Clostridium taeniosporum TaxID=394958 RepID=A0A1D7XIK4_9CLOT|nr:CDC27 family protein [Clostridium taeniosporum]AOR23146.1 hypothetical protein BGI42_05140 [Clostridium taeniosporum]